MSTSLLWDVVSRYVFHVIGTSVGGDTDREDDPIWEFSSNPIFYFLMIVWLVLWCLLCLLLTTVLQKECFAKCICNASFPNESRPHGMVSWNVGCFVCVSVCCCSLIKSKLWQRWKLPVTFVQWYCTLTRPATDMHLLPVVFT